jgi:hypothetical protein
MRALRAGLVGSLLLGGTLGLGLFAEPAASRYGVGADLQAFPQATPKDAFASVLKAIEAKQIRYLLAQLADPTWVDQRVQTYNDSFDEVVKESTVKLGNPATIKELRRYLTDGEWEEFEGTAWSRLPGVEERVFLRKVGTRWFLENRKLVKPVSKKGSPCPQE